MHSPFVRAAGARADRVNLLSIEAEAGRIVRTSRRFDRRPA
jgi:hypothetical protein